MLWHIHILLSTKPSFTEVLLCTITCNKTTEIVASNLLWLLLGVHGIKCCLSSGVVVYLKETVLLCHIVTNTKTWYRDALLSWYCIPVVHCTTSVCIFKCITASIETWAVQVTIHSFNSFSSHLSKLLGFWLLISASHKFDWLKYCQFNFHYTFGMWEVKLVEVLTGVISLSSHSW